MANIKITVIQNLSVEELCHLFSVYLTPRQAAFFVRKLEKKYDSWDFSLLVLTAAMRGLMSMLRIAFVLTMKRNFKVC